MTPREPHAARPLTSEAIVLTPPAATLTRRRTPVRARVVNAMNLLSGDQAGCQAPAVPLSATIVVEFSERITSLPSASTVPVGDCDVTAIRRKGHQAGAFTELLEARVRDEIEAYGFSHRRRAPEKRTGCSGQDKDRPGRRGHPQSCASSGQAEPAARRPPPDPPVRAPLHAPPQSNAVPPTVPRRTATGRRDPLPDICEPDARVLVAPTAAEWL